MVVAIQRYAHLRTAREEIVSAVLVAAKGRKTRRTSSSSWPKSRSRLCALDGPLTESGVGSFAASWARSAQLIPRRHRSERPRGGARYDDGASAATDRAPPPAQERSERRFSPRAQPCHSPGLEHPQPTPPKPLPPDLLARKQLASLAPDWSASTVLEYWRVQTVHVRTCATETWE
jgi:hypothetical protein